MQTCPHHGAHNGTDACPTCLRIAAARDLLRLHPHGCGPAHRAARELLDDLGERVADAPRYREGDAVSFDIGGAA